MATVRISLVSGNTIAAEMDSSNAKYLLRDYEEYLIKDTQNVREYRKENPVGVLIVRLASILAIEADA